MSFSNPNDDEIRRILSQPATVAVVGCSDSPARDSLRIAMLLRNKGFKVIPVNPTLPPGALLQALGERCYPDLASVPEPIEFVNVFRRPQFCAEVAREAVAAGAKALWLQQGIVSPEARRIAEAAGLEYVEDACVMAVHRIAGLGRAG